ncbi:MAG: HAD family hydrolase [Dehalococcoidia bacterium]
MTQYTRSEPYEIITFDCYGTLIDWDGGIVAAFQTTAQADGIRLEAAAVLDAYHAVEPKVEAGPFRPYWEVLTETAWRVADRLGWQLPADHAGFLADSVPNWPPFADTNAALERLAASGYRLGILSNVDDDILAGTRRHFTVPFEFTITALQLQSYKPARSHFDAARARIGNSSWLHAAQSYFHDIVPAAALAIPVAWVNRKHESPSVAARPTREVSTLAALADWLT